MLKIFSSDTKERTSIVFPEAFAFLKTHNNPLLNSDSVYRLSPPYWKSRCLDMLWNNKGFTVLPRQQGICFWIIYKLHFFRIKIKASPQAIRYIT